MKRRQQSTGSQQVRRIALEQGAATMRRSLPWTSPGRNPQERAGKFGSFVGTLSEAEASEMQTAIDEACETISEEW